MRAFYPSLFELQKPHICCLGIGFGYSVDGLPLQFPQYLLQVDSRMMPQSSIEKLFCRFESTLFRRQIWQRRPGYWKWKRALMVMRWRLFRWYLAARDRSTARVQSTQMFVSISRSVVGPTALAILTTILLNFVQYYLHSRGIWLPQSWRTGGTFSPDTYTNLLATVAQVTGVFLGLYFTAVSAVASAAYAKVPNTVRALVIHEKVGNVYVQLVAFEAALAMLLLAAYTRSWFSGLFESGSGIIRCAFLDLRIRQSWFPRILFSRSQLCLQVS